MYFVLALVLSQLFPDLTGQIICGALWGFSFGGFLSSTVAILKRLFEDLDSAWAIMLICAAISSFCGPIVSGNIITSTYYFTSYGRGVKWIDWIASLLNCKIILFSGAIYDHLKSYAPAFYGVGAAVMIAGTNQILTPLQRIMKLFQNTWNHSRRDLRNIKMKYIQTLFCWQWHKQSLYFTILIILF